MPRWKIVQGADIIGPLNMVNCVGDYVASKHQTAVVTRRPNWDSYDSTAQLICLENLRELQAMQATQLEILENENQQEIVNMRRHTDLEKMHCKLRRRLIDVNFFLKDFADKRRAAEKKLQHESKVQANLTKDIGKSKQAIRELRGFRELIGEIAEAMSPYERVLKSVVKVSGLYTSVGDCMNRCDSLLLANHEIQRMQDLKLLEIDEMRKRMLQITADAQLKVLGLKTELTELERMYTDACGRCQRWERILTEARAAVLDHNLNKERVLDGLFMLYNLLVKRNGHAPNKDITRKDVEHIMDYLRDEVQLLNQVVKACRHVPSPMGQKKSPDRLPKAAAAS